MKRFLWVMAVTVCLGTSSYALPRFALIKGDANCLNCHTNPTGGGIRNSGGEGFAKNVLAMWKRGDEFSGQISEGIRIGADFRTQYLCFSQTFPLGATDTTISSGTSHAMSAALMFDASLTNTLHAYLRYDPLASKNEMYGTLHFVDESGELLESGSVVTNAYVKTGAFLPAFGIRFDDHTLYTRGGNRGISGFGAAGLFWTEGYRDVGLELGATLFDHVGIQMSYLNGSEQSPNANFSFDPNNKSALCFRATASAEVVEDVFSFEVGGSAYMHPSDDSTQDLSLMSVHVGLYGGPVSLLAEYDFGKHVFRTANFDYVPKMNALSAELAVRVTQGLDIIGRFETYKDQVNDSLRVVDGNKVDSRITIGAQWFPIRFLEIRPEVRLAAVTSRAGKVYQEADQNTYLVQAHFYF